jgi:HipA-like protein
MLKTFVNKFWFPEENDQFHITENKDVNFQLYYNNEIIGNLSFMDGCWKFEYSDEFKLQNKILPLVNFPQKEKTYQSNTLWPFFASRIPGSAQLMASEKNQDTDLTHLLKKYGKRSITNPFVLQAVF